MSFETSKYKIRSLADPTQHLEVTIESKDYAEALRAGTSLSAVLTQRYGAATNEEEYGSVLSQCMQAAGMYLHQNFQMGIKPPSLSDIMSDKTQLHSGISAGVGSDTSTPSARLLFPEVILQAMQESLIADDSDFFRTWNKLFANTLTVTSSSYMQPKINSTHNEATRSKAISQGTEPGNMVSITTSDKIKRIPRKSIGLTVTDEALQQTTLDLVSLVMNAQARGERYANAMEILNAILNGDTDMGETGIASAGTFQALDSAITTAGTITHKALVKYLRQNYRYLQPNLLLMDLDSAFAIEARAGKPVDANGYKADGTLFNIQPTVDNLLAKAPPILIMETAAIGANTVVGLDTSMAFRRVININANYSAIQEFIMRRVTMFRLDYGETAETLWPDAISKRTMTV